MLERVFLGLLGGDGTTLRSTLSPRTLIVLIFDCRLVTVVVELALVGRALDGFVIL